MVRAFCRTNTTSFSKRMSKVNRLRTGNGLNLRSFCDQNCYIIPLTTKVSMEHGGDHTRGFTPNAGVLVQIPTAGQSIGVHDENAVVVPWTRELLNSLRGHAESAVVRSHAAAGARRDDGSGNISNASERQQSLF